MSTIQDVETKCYICGTEYSGSILTSSYSGLPTPDIKPLSCPTCGAAYKPFVELQAGLVKDILLDLLKSQENADDRLFRYARTQKELTDWIEYIHNYLAEDAFSQWRAFNIETHSVLEGSSVDTLEEMYKSGALNQAIDLLQKNVRVRIDEELSKYNH